MGRMWPPQSVNTWPTPAWRSVRATRCPPFRSTLASARRQVHHLQLQAVGILEEHRVVARAVLGELARRPVERVEPAGPHELVPEAVHFLAPLHAEGEVIEPGTLPMEARRRVPGRRGHDPDVGSETRAAGDGVALVHRPIVQVAEERLVEGKRAGRVANVDLDVVDLRPHQNFSHFTLLRSMPFLTSTSRTRLMVSPPPQA